MQSFIVKKMEKLSFTSLVRLISLCVLFATNTQAQFVKIDNGVVISSFNNEKDLPFFQDRVINYSFLIGMDYMEKNWFYLSSQVGYMRLGGEETNPLLQGEFSHITEHKSFVHFNTTFRGYIRSSGFKITAGLGPYINVLAANDDFDSSLYEGYDYQAIHTGAISEFGLTHDTDKLRVGLIGRYMLGLSSTASTEFISLYTDAFSLMVTVGYNVL